MNEIVLLYLWTRLDVLSYTFLALMISCVVAALFSFTAYVDTRDDAGEAVCVSLIKRFVLAAVMFLMLFVLLPSKKDAAIIAGGWIVSKAAQSDIAKEVGAKTWAIVQGKLDEQLKELEVKK